MVSGLETDRAHSYGSGTCMVEINQIMQLVFGMLRTHNANWCTKGDDQRREQM